MSTPMGTPDAADLLDAMAKTYRARNAVYGSNYRNVGNAIAALFPDGVVLKTGDDYMKWHLFELIMVKLSRLAVSNLTHVDSAHDTGVYAAMLESVIRELEERNELL